MLITGLLKPISQAGRSPRTAACYCFVEADRLLGLSEAIAQALPDPRRAASCDHDTQSLLQQRIQSYWAMKTEDLNDHDTLRQDVALQTAVERDLIFPR